jgi:Pyruvate/2-oxoacid:ferredoxin oxidoreductase delta subunit
MPEQATEERTKRRKIQPRPETLALLKTSGNPINGLGETEERRPSPFFWHPPTMHPFEDLQVAARAQMSRCPGYDAAFSKARNHPPLVPIAATRREVSAEEFTAQVSEFALSHEADDVGITPMSPLYVFEGYTIEEPTVILLAVGHNYERLKQVPSDETNGEGICDVGDQYARGTRSSFALANWIRSQGYNARAFPGPSADALLLIPAAVASGLGELGKHGSMISRKFGAGVRLAGVTTDMPLVTSRAEPFGADEFCKNCQVCTRACPPGAISEQKQMVRGVERWFVDFDKCIPAFTELSGCAICIAECPWTRPTVRPKLLATMARRLGSNPSPIVIP